MCEAGKSGRRVAPHKIPAGVRILWGRRGGGGVNHNGTFKPLFYGNDQNVAPPNANIVRIEPVEWGISF